MIPIGRFLTAHCSDHSAVKCCTDNDSPLAPSTQNATADSTSASSPFTCYTAKLLYVCVCVVVCILKVLMSNWEGEKIAVVLTKLLLLLVTKESLTYFSPQAAPSVWLAGRYNLTYKHTYIHFVRSSYSTPNNVHEHHCRTYSSGQWQRHI